MADRSLRSEARPAPARSAPKRSHDRRAGTAGEDLPTPRRPDPSPSDLALLTAEVETLRVDLDAARARVQELEAKADIDPLLDVFNRRGFERALVSALSYMTRYGAHAALLYVDLDAFKPVNDRHGHAAGDAVLRAVAAALTRNVRASDVVARLGGDEFALLLWNLSENDAIAKAHALEEAIAAIKVSWEGTVLSVGASAGVAMLAPSDNPGEILHRADQAMYARKAARRVRR